MTGTSITRIFGGLSDARICKESTVQKYHRPTVAEPDRIAGGGWPAWSAPQMCHPCYAPNLVATANEQRPLPAEGHPLPAI
jgi:hypothetical protein